MRRLSAIFILALFFSETSLPAWEGTARAWAAAPLVEAKLKSDSAILEEDKNKTALQKPNLLFLIEATEIMSFTPQGVQPQVWRDALFDFHWEETADWKLTKEKYGYTIYDINRIMKEATFGMGALPPAWRGEDLEQGRNLYGRERKKTNNFKKGRSLSEDMELNKDNYYFPFADPEYAKKHMKGVYSGQSTGLEVGYTGYPDVWPDDVLPRDYKYEQRGRAGYDYTHCRTSHPNRNDNDSYRGEYGLRDREGRRYGDYNGDAVVRTYSYRSVTNSQNSFPYALVFKNPQHWTNPPSSWSEDDLVPNDSRMYQVKLVLWNLLSDKNRFKDLRIGMATTFLSPANLERASRKNTQNHHEIAWDQNPDTNGVFKVFPFGANIRTKSYFLSEREGGDAYITDLGASNRSNWSKNGIYQRKEIPGWITLDRDGFNMRPTGSGELYRRVRYENGTMHGPSTGEVESFFHVHGQHYPLWMNATSHALYMTPNNDGTEPDGWWSNGAVPKDTDGSGKVSVQKGWFEGTARETAVGGNNSTAAVHNNDINDMSKYNERHTRALGWDLHSAGEVWDRPMYKILRRASLWLPIQDSNYVWEKSHVTLDQVDKFKLWINGLADIKSAGKTKETDWNEQSWTNHGDSLNSAFRSGQFHFYNDPEIGIAGMFGLAQAIFPDPTPLDYTPGHTYPWRNPDDRKLELDREYYRRRGWVWYSKRIANTDYTYDYRRASQEYDDTAVPRARFNYASGEATGSVLDFFSPKKYYSFTGTDAYRTTDDYIPVTQPQIVDSYGSNKISTTDLHRVSFPIRSECEDNWLIVVASGAEPKVVDKAAYSYNAWEAIKNLYDATDKKNKGVPVPSYNPNVPNHGIRKAAYEPVTRIKPELFQKDPRLGTETGRPLTEFDLETIDLDNPIRTIVIGIVADENDPDVIAAGSAVVDEVKNMRLNLIKMANAGQGALSGTEIANLHWGNMYDAPIQPYWASNVSALRIAFDAALGAVRTAEDPSGADGAMVQQKENASVAESKLFSATYQVVYNNQWNGTLRRYRPVVKNGAVVSMDKTSSWELGSKLLDGRGNGNAPGGIMPMYWAPGEKKFRKFSQGEATSLNIFGLDGRLETVSSASKPLPPNEALYRWLVGYDHSYVNDKSYRRNHMLADFGQSGIALAANPSKSADSLPGYSVWAKSRSGSNAPMLYGQTNDGILYAVNPENGNPEMVILPPPSLLPMRIASLKSTEGASGKRVWIEVATPDGKSGGRRSLPGYILDGSLQVRNLDIGSNQSHDWRQYMLGALGRGGSGLYMIDVSEHKDPKFKWYVEKYGNQVVTMDGSSRHNAPTWTDLSALSGNAVAFRKLGFNGAKPAIGVTLTGNDPLNPSIQNIIVVPGGLQSKIDLAKNGGEGAAILVLDPKDGSVIRAFDGETLDRGQTKNWKVGSSVQGKTPYMGMVASEPTLMVSSNTAMKFAPYATGRAFTADNRGNIFEVVMENPDGSSLQPSGWSIRTAATLQPNSNGGAGTDKNFAIPHGLALKKASDKVWLAGGTSNAETLGKSRMENGDGNLGQMLFALKSPINPAPGDRTIYRDDLRKLDMRSASSAPPDATGWYMPLDTAAGMKQNVTADEYVTARPALLGDNMYASTFTRTKIELTGVYDVCNASKKTVSGYSRLYSIKIADGTSSWPVNKSRYIQVEGVKITGMTNMKNDDGSATLVFNYDVLGNDPAKDKAFLDLAAKNGINVSNGSLVMQVRDGGTSQPALPPGDTVIIYSIERAK
ncbi:MAG: hypothetical protein LBQ56_06770 [Synergistaceae bacterium]|jgi:hypothetical protein|nr:hypothetical protein [Synergistaceae bacterium]